MRNVCLGLTGAALQACLGAQQQVPPVRPAPLPQECPAGAVETMTRTLGLRIGEIEERRLGRRAGQARARARGHPAARAGRLGGGGRSDSGRG